MTRNTSPAEILLMYGLSLMICGALAFQASDYKDSAKSSLYMGNGGAVLSFLLAAGTRKMASLEKGQPGYVLMMICIHLALLYPVLMAAVVSWRLSLAWNAVAKAYVIPYLVAIIVCSLGSFVLLYSFKPTKTKKVADGDDSSTTSSREQQLQQEQKFKHLSSDDTASSLTQDTESDVGLNGSSDTFGHSSENGTLGTMGSGDRNTVNDAAHSHSHRHGSKSSSGDKPQKQQVVRRRPRRAQAM